LTRRRRVCGVPRADSVAKALGPAYSVRYGLSGSTHFGKQRRAAREFSVEEQMADLRGLE
jgi:hypothetical protein